MANNVEYNVTGSDECNMIVTITINGVKHSLRELEDRYEHSCEYDADDAVELEDIVSEAWRVLRDARWNCRQRRIEEFWAKFPDHECEDSDPIIRHW